MLRQEAVGNGGKQKKRRKRKRNKRKLKPVLNMPSRLLIINEFNTELNVSKGNLKGKSESRMNICSNSRRKKIRFISKGNAVPRLYSLCKF